MTDYGDMTPRPAFDGQWQRFVPHAWQLLADPKRDGPVPTRPVVRGNGAENEGIAWWAPLLELTIYGLGWPRPDRGLARWWEMGRPTDDPVLALIDRWWGDAVEEAISWGERNHVLRQVALDVHQSMGGHFVDDDALRYSTSSDARRRSVATFGEMDNMHLSYHCLEPRRDDEVASTDVVTVDGTRRVLFVADEYRGWYHSLSTRVPRQTATGRSHHVDVTCRTTGHLGTYKWSSQTGRWFRGRHRWHALGASPDAT